MAGIAADLLAFNPHLTPDQVKGALMVSARDLRKVRSLAGGVGEAYAAGATSVGNPPNPNRALDAFLVSDPTGDGMVFDDVSWLDAVASPAWDSVSWLDGWADASWSLVSWSDVSWSDVSWSDDVSWADRLRRRLVSWADVPGRPRTGHGATERRLGAAADDEFRQVLLPSSSASRARAHAGPTGPGA